LATVGDELRSKGGEPELLSVKATEKPWVSGESKDILPELGQRPRGEYLENRAAQNKGEGKCKGVITVSQPPLSATIRVGKAGGGCTVGQEGGKKHGR